MTREDLIEKKSELEGKIITLNEQLRFGSSGNISGINAIAQMKDNLKLVEAALKDMPVEDVPAHVDDVPDGTDGTDGTDVTDGSPQPQETAPVVPPVEEPIIEPAPEGIEAQLGTGE